MGQSFYKTTECLSSISLVINFHSTITSDGAWPSFMTLCRSSYQGKVENGHPIPAAVTIQVKAICSSSKPQDSLMTRQVRVKID